MDFIEIIKARGFVHQFTDEEGLRAALAQGPQTAYIGFDCTARSLHVGSLLQIMLLRWWQKCGHRPIVLMGGGTTKIGDPTGRDESRPVITDETIAENMAGIRTVFDKFIDFNHAEMVNNDDWLSKLSLMDMLQIGRHFSVNRMIKQKSVQLRLERDQEMSLLEFNYSVMQAYDFAELYKKYGCRVQMGGSDQWGNIVAGIDLHRRLSKGAGPEIFGITSPLITTASGAKMGKTAGGAVWLNADMLPPYDYWQFWRNTEDADVGKFLKLFTELSLEEIARLEALGGAEINEAKKILATEATALLHGRDEAEKARATAAETFAGAGVSDNLPIHFVSAAELEAGIPIVSLVVAAGFATSNGEARRLIKGNGIKVNDAAVAEDARIGHGEMIGDGYIKLSAGKKRHLLVKQQ